MGYAVFCGYFGTRVDFRGSREHFLGDRELPLFFPLQLFLRACKRFLGAREYIQVAWEGL